jgi:hypothetical protein
MTTHRLVLAARIAMLASLASLPASLAAAQGAEAFHMPAIDTYREIVDRPLFSSDRRPAPVLADRGAVASVVLTGVIVLPETRLAVIKEGTAPARSVPEGTQLGIGTIEQVTRDGISLRLADGRIAAMTVVRPVAAQAAAAANPSRAAAIPTAIADMPVPADLPQIEAPRPSPPYIGQPATADIPAPPPESNR